MAYIRADYELSRNVPWIDDERGTVMNAVTRVLNAGWNDRELTEDEAIRMLNRVRQQMRINGRQGTPSRSGGYYSLPDAIRRRSGYCFEVAQIGFWFFSELEMPSITQSAHLEVSNLHLILRLPLTLSNSSTGER